MFNTGLDVMVREIDHAPSYCDACRSETGERKSCHGCSFARYCNRECQTVGWPSHKLVCKILAADKEIATKLPMVTASSPLLSPKLFWESLRGGSNADVYAAAMYFAIVLKRAYAENRGAACAAALQPSGGAAMPADGVPLLVSLLGAGGLRAAGVATLLAFILRVRRDADISTALVSAGAVPLLVVACALPFRYPSLELRWGLRCAATSATEVLGMLAPAHVFGQAILDAGAVPVLLASLAGREENMERAVDSILGSRFRSVMLLNALYAGCVETNAALEGAIGRACVTAGCAPLVSCLRSDDPELASSAAEALAHILRTSGGDRGIAVAASKESSSIVAMLGGVEPNALAAIYLLSHIFRAVPEKRLAAVEAGLLPALMPCLGGSLKLMLQALSPLGEVVKLGPATVERAFAAGALPPLLRLLAHREDRPRGAAASILGDMVLDASRARLSQALTGEAARLLVACLSSPNADLVLEAASTLALFAHSAIDGPGDPASDFARQVEAGCGWPRLVELIGQKGETSSHVVLALHNLINYIPSYHAPLVRSGLPRALIAFLSSGAAGSAPRLDGRDEACTRALSLLTGLLAGPSVHAAAEAVMAAQGLRVLVAALPRGGPMRSAACLSLLCICGATPHHRGAVIAAGAVAPLLAFLKKEEGGIERASAARALSCLASADASVAAELAAAGFDAARLERLSKEYL